MKNNGTIILPIMLTATGMTVYLNNTLDSSFVDLVCIFGSLYGLWAILDITLRDIFIHETKFDINKFRIQ